LQSALRARYEHNNWLKIIQPINNRLRGLQRDALMAFVLHSLQQSKKTSAINTPDKLFEHFLIDVQMDSCMKTSRIKQAIASVQLFIQRCLLNLEPGVSPRSIKAGQWKWMNRYRVWEANRKVFLWPENWLEPELRVKKCAFFKELESELLQGDINDDAAATALVHYLEKLEDIAKLEICGMYYEENDLNNRADDIVHVIGRTAGMKRTYYYRRLEGDISWTPWEKISLNIEDNPVLPVVWKGRFFLFWVTVLKKTVDSKSLDNGKEIELTKKMNVNTLKSVASTAKIQIEVMLNWSEYYHGKWQPIRTSDVNAPLVLGKDFEINQFDRNKLKLSSLESFLQEDSRALVLSVIYPGNRWGCFKLYNTHSLPSLEVADIIMIDIAFHEAYPQNKLFKDNNVLNIDNSHYQITEPHHRVNDVSNAPFFLQDTRHVFYVKSATSTITVGGHLDLGIQPPTYKVIDNLPDLHIIPKFTQGARGFFPGEELVPPDVDGLGHFNHLFQENKYIQQVLITPDLFRFGNRQINPIGSSELSNWRN
jgi:hypothetical protein